LPRDGFAAVAIATALEGGVDLLPPEDRLRPYRAEGLDDRITLSSTSSHCPLPPTMLRGAPRFGLQGASVDIYGYSGGARDASIGIPGEPSNSLLDTAPSLDTSVELALTFDSSCDLKEDDSITFSLPDFRGDDVNDEAKVEYAGADAEKPRLPSATFDFAFSGGGTENAKVVLTASSNAAAGPRTLTIGASYGLRPPPQGLPKGPVGLTATISSNCTGGALNPVPLDAAPSYGTFSNASIAFEPSTANSLSTMILEVAPTSSLSRATP
jgi:hypothetical protein